QGRGARRAARGRLGIVTHTLASQVTVVGAVHDGPAARMLEVILERESAASVVTFAGDATQAGGDAASTVIVPAARPDLVRAARDSGATVVTAGFTADADVRGSALEARSAGTGFTLLADGEECKVRLAILGEHLADAAVLAIAAARAVGIRVAHAVAAIESVTHVAAGVMQPLRAAG